MLGKDLETGAVTIQHLSLLGRDSGGTTEVAEVTDSHQLSTTDFKLSNTSQKFDQVSKP